MRCCRSAIARCRARVVPGARISAPARSARSATSSGSCSRAGGWRSAISGAALLLALTIIGLPFAWAHLKLAGLALWPIGRMIVLRDDAAPAYARWR